MIFNSLKGACSIPKKKLIQLFINLFLCIGGVNVLHGLTDTIRVPGVREVAEAMDIDQMTNPNVRKAVLAMRKEVQKIPAFAIQSTHGTPCKGVDDSLLSRAATM